IHSFIVIAPNHTGDDLILFESQANSKSEFYLRQITGSANFRTGGDLNDFLHGWLNYQIEHHLWPDLPMSEYQRLQPQVKALCAKYGIPYVQESVWKRLKKTVDVMVGKTSMPRQASISGNLRAMVGSVGRKDAAATR
ncbi:MAG TPA: fatty acid desaturase, partial [Fluviicoccus sp.]|nr:fatty acid desaturase [Fluviicoccus sp.]